MTDAWTPLGSLKPGASGHIREIRSAKLDMSEDHLPFDMMERLRELGFEEGLPFEIMHQAPMGRDPMAVRVGAMTVALRRSDANLILVELDED